MSPSPHNSSPHSSNESFWRNWVGSLGKDAPTPCFLFSAEPIAAGLVQLDEVFAGLPVKHWLSVKTQPLPALIAWWIRQGRPVEVVSELELELVLHLGCPADRILVNGPAKHRWLTRHRVPRLNVHFDSVMEMRELAPLARQLEWRCGVRLLTSEEFDPEAPSFPTQFGLSSEELPVGLAVLKKHRVKLETIHFHLRTNVSQADCYRRAMDEALCIASEHRIMPSVLDIGGGFPAPEIRGRGGKRVDAEFSMAKVADALRSARKRYPGIREVWLENGRWMSARSGALLIRILDAKERRGHRNLICDGGRTLHGLVSLWEHHAVLTFPRRKGPERLSTVNGPTCMAFDQLARRPLPDSLRVGDRLLWLDAGAYHLPWETRFSHGLAAIHWHEGETHECVRSAESFADWNRTWRTADRTPGSDRA